MRRILTALTLLACLGIPVTILATEAVVEISGPPELTALKEGIGKTITTRCIARGVPVESLSRLSVTISALGDVISFDALLDTAPPKAFHRDMKDASGISPTIDEMIGVLFPGTGETAATQATQKGQDTGKEQAPRIKLPFSPTSIASAGDRIFLSDEHTVYELVGEKASPLWKAPGNNEILRIYTRNGSILVLAKRSSSLQTFLIRNADIEKRWDKAVIPVGSGLVSTGITFDRNLDTTGYRWTRVSREEGTTPEIPEGHDIISAVTAQVFTAVSGTQVLSYNPSGRLTISEGSSTLWTDDEKAGITPLYIESPERKEGINSETELPGRYSLRPRIVASESGIVTFRNDQGLGGMLTRMNLFDSARILRYRVSGDDLTQTVLSTIEKGFCIDIAVVRNRAAALVVHGNSAYVEFIGL